MNKQDYMAWEENEMLRFDQIMEIMGHQGRKYGLNCVGKQESLKGCEKESAIVRKFDLTRQ